MREAGLRVPIVKMFSNDERLDDLNTFDPGVLPEPRKRPSSRNRRRSRLL